MTFEEATALLPMWVQIWLNFLLLGAFILPITLLIWKQTRITGIITLLASVIASFVIMSMYDKLGLVRLLGLPHIIFWTPIVIYLLKQFQRADVPKIPKGIIAVITVTIVISLVFDYYDVIRYFLGDTAPTV